MNVEKIGEQIEVRFIETAFSEFEVVVPDDTERKHQEEPCGFLADDIAEHSDRK